MCGVIQSQQKQGGRAAASGMVQELLAWGCTGKDLEQAVILSIKGTWWDLGIKQTAVLKIKDVGPTSLRFPWWGEECL